MSAYCVMARMAVDVSRTISAESLMEAFEHSKKLNVSDFIQLVKQPNGGVNDCSDFEIYGVFEE